VELQLPDDAGRIAKIAAIHTGCTVSELITDLVRQYADTLPSGPPGQAQPVVATQATSAVAPRAPQCQLILLWIHQELAAKRTPTRQQICDRFTISKASLSSYLSRWRVRQSLTKEQIATIT